MSARHRNKSLSVKEPREARTAKNRRIRRLSRQAMHVAAVAGTVDELMLPEPVRSVESPSLAELGAVEPRRFKVWKTKMWKRRNLERQRRARAEAAAGT